MFDVTIDHFRVLMRIFRKTKECEVPRLVGFKKSGDLSCLFVVGDKVHITVAEVFKLLLCTLFSA